MDGSDTWNPSDPTELSYWGWDASLTPVAGDWNKDGKDELGVYSKGVWFRDADNSHTWNAANQQALAYFGWSGALPVVGNWAGSGSPLIAAEGAVVASSNTPTLTQAELRPTVTEALARWTAAGLNAQALDAMRQVEFVVTDLPGAYLGLAQTNRVYLDTDAAGHGWFVDPTPTDDLEFADVLGPDTLSARNDSAAAKRVDLLTAVMHEMGHLLDYEHSDSLDLMYPALPLGTRRFLGEGSAFSIEGRQSDVSLSSSLVNPSVLDQVFASFQDVGKRNWSMV
jgi:hypothetical protein